MVVPSNQCLFLIASAHNDIGHHGVYATNALLSKRYWWPNMSTDIKWYI
jgi:Integrase zinc binding domain